MATDPTAIEARARNPDPWAALNVKRGTPVEVVKAEYRKLLKILHPDKNGKQLEHSDTINRLQEAMRTIEAGARGSGDIKPPSPSKSKWAQYADENAAAVRKVSPHATSRPASKTTWVRPCMARQPSARHAWGPEAPTAAVPVQSNAQKRNAKLSPGHAAPSDAECAVQKPAAVSAAAAVTLPAAAAAAEDKEADNNAWKQPKSKLRSEGHHATTFSPLPASPAPCAAATTCDADAWHTRRPAAAAAPFGRGTMIPGASFYAAPGCADAWAGPSKASKLKRQEQHFSAAKPGSDAHAGSRQMVDGCCSDPSSDSCSSDSDRQDRQDSGDLTSGSHDSIAGGSDSDDSDFIGCSKAAWKAAEAKPLQQQHQQHMTSRREQRQQRQGQKVDADTEKQGPQQEGDRQGHMQAIAFGSAAWRRRAWGRQPPAVRLDSTAAGKEAAASGDASEVCVPLQAAAAPGEVSRRGAQAVGDSGCRWAQWGRRPHLQQQVPAGRQPPQVHCHQQQDPGMEHEQQTSSPAAVLGMEHQPRQLGSSPVCLGLGGVQQQETLEDTDHVQDAWNDQRQWACHDRLQTARSTGSCRNVLTVQSQRCWEPVMSGFELAQGHNADCTITTLLQQQRQVQPQVDMEAEGDVLVVPRRRRRLAHVMQRVLASPGEQLEAGQSPIPSSQPDDDFADQHHGTAGMAEQSRDELLRCDTYVRSSGRGGLQERRGDVSNAEHDGSVNMGRHGTCGGLDGELLLSMQGLSSMRGSMAGVPEVSAMDVAVRYAQQQHKPQLQLLLCRQSRLHESPHEQEGHQQEQGCRVRLGDNSCQGPEEEENQGLDYECWQQGQQMGRCSNRNGYQQQEKQEIQVLAGQGWQEEDTLHVGLQDGFLHQQSGEQPEQQGYSEESPTHSFEAGGGAMHPRQAGVCEVEASAEQEWQAMLQRGRERLRLQQVVSGGGRGDQGTSQDRNAAGWAELHSSAAGAGAAGWWGGVSLPRRQSGGVAPRNSGSRAAAATRGSGRGGSRGSGGAARGGVRLSKPTLPLCSPGSALQPGEQEMGEPGSMEGDLARSAVEAFLQQKHSSANQDAISVAIQEVKARRAAHGRFGRKASSKGSGRKAASSKPAAVSKAAAQKKSSILYYAKAKQS